MRKSVAEPTTLGVRVSLFTFMTAYGDNLILLPFSLSNQLQKILNLICQLAS